MCSAAHVYAGALDTEGQAAFEPCGLCHEYDGNPRMSHTPVIAGQWPAYMKKQLLDYRAGKRHGDMDGTVDTTSDQDIDEAVRYFSQQQPRQGNSDGISAAEKVLARKLFNEGDARRGTIACLNCHGLEGHGTLIAPRIAGQHQDYLLNQLLEFKSGARRNDPTGKMRNAIKYLRKDELRALAGYVSSLPAKSYMEVTH
jgi:cytochrome c553